MTTDTPTATAAALNLSRRKAMLFRLILLTGTLIVIALTTVAAELVLRNRERHRATAPDYFPTIFYPHRRLTYALIPNLDYYGWFKINSLGFRGREIAARKPPETIRIVCLGGSTTFDTGVVGTAVPWPDVLERELGRVFPDKRIEVLNLGIPGAAILDSLIDLQIRGLTLDPDIVILYQGHNDFRYSTRPPGEPSGYFPGEQATRTSMGRWLQVHSLLYAKAYTPAQNLLQRMLTKMRLTSDAEQTLTTERQNARAMEALAMFRSHLGSIAAIADQNHIKLVLPELIFPRSDKNGTGDCNLCRRMPPQYGGMPYETIAGWYDKYNGTLRDVATARAAYYVPTMGWVLPTPESYSDTVHFTPQGSLAMGTRLSEAISPFIRSILAENVSR